VSERGTPTVYEVNFITPTLALSLPAGGPSPEAHETLCVVADVMRRIGGDGPSMLCLTCEHEFVDDLPPVIVVAKPFALNVGTVIVSPVCSTCAAKGQEAVFADAIERFRADGMADCREITMGRA
jgi:hypothetical protein